MVTPVYLTVQTAARRLGVSPDTVRRWTSEGILPCVRTAGGHRRIRKDDVDDLVHLIKGESPLAARQAHERVMDALVETSVALAEKVNTGELLKELARRLTGILGCHFCAISTYDAEAQTVTTLADYDSSGHGTNKCCAFDLARYPLTRSVLQEQRTAIVNVDDVRADPAEAAELRHGGDKSLLMVPLVYRGEAIGLLELIDHVTSRRWSRSEIRLCSAIAGQAAAALQNAKVYGAAQEAAAHAGRLGEAMASLSDALGELDAARTVDEVLGSTARLACRLPGVLNCVAHGGDAVAAACRAPGEARPTDAAARAAVVMADPSERSDFSFSVSLVGEPRDGDLQLLGLLASLAGGALTRLGVVVIAS
jgi:excisionase family DNA binding protein